MRKFENKCITQMSYKYDWPILNRTTAATIYVMGPAAKKIMVARRGKRGKQGFNLPAADHVTNFTDNQVDTNVNSVSAQRPYQTNNYQNHNLNNVPAYNPMGFESQKVGSSVPSVHFGIEAVKANTPGAQESYIS